MSDLLAKALVLYAVAHPAYALTGFGMWLAITKWNTNPRPKR